MMTNRTGIDTRLAETENWVRSTQLNRRGLIVAGAAATGYALAAEPLSASVITTDSVGLDSGMTAFKTGDIMMRAYRARPAGKKRAPVIIVVQEIFGLHEWIKDICRRYAKAGFDAIAPDLFQRQGDATQYTDIRKLVTEIVAKVPDAQVMSDVDACAAFAGAGSGSGRGRRKPLGITGFCWGGRITWLYAAHNPQLKAGVAWYGRLALASGGTANALQPRQPIELVPDLRAPVLGLYGALDKGIPLADVDAMNRALAAARKRSSIVVYPDADHGFLADYRPSYNARAAGEAWSQSLAHFRTYLK